MVQQFASAEKEEAMLFWTVIGSHLFQKFPLERTQRIAISILQEINRYWKRGIDANYEGRKMEYFLSQTAALLKTIPVYLETFPSLTEVALEYLSGKYKIIRSLQCSDKQEQKLRNSRRTWNGEPGTTVFCIEK